jgi:quercetin dioxygenase-like cupin family protein
VKVVPASELARLATGPSSDEPVSVDWLLGPANGDPLDVGIASFGPGVVVPPHLHVGGQVIVGVSGHGFVEVDGERVEFGPGDVVVCPPGELHSHGADASTALVHLVVTTGGYEFPDQPTDVVAQMTDRDGRSS